MCTQKHAFSFLLAINFITMNTRYFHRSSSYRHDHPQPHAQPQATPPAPQPLDEDGFFEFEREADIDNDDDITIDFENFSKPAFSGCKFSVFSLALILWRLNILLSFLFIL